MNKVLKSYRGEWSMAAILETPCWPACYYAGFVYSVGNELFPEDNATSKFHRTLEEAQDHFDRAVQWIVAHERQR